MSDSGVEFAQVAGWFLNQNPAEQRKGGEIFYITSLDDLKSS